MQAVIELSMEELNAIELHEGQEYGAFKAERIFNDFMISLPIRFL